MASKMILVPEEVWKKINTNSGEKIINTLDDLENQISILLNSEKFSDCEKIQLINHLQNRYNKINNGLKSLNSDAISEDEKYFDIKENVNKNKIREEILEAFTKTTKKRGEQLFNFLEKSIIWNEKGELVINNKKIDNSNIIDLLLLTVSNKSKFDYITGINEFTELLHNINVPRHFIVNNKLKKLIDKQKQPENKKEKIEIKNQKPLIWEEIYH